jgi:hypothetical protein
MNLVNEEIHDNGEKMCNCVRISHVLKRMPDNQNVMRQIDSILQQLKYRIGPISAVFFPNNTKHGFIEDDTIGFIKPKNKDKLRDLVFSFNSYNFHGKALLACLATFTFVHIDDHYAPFPIKCKNCDDYLKDLEEYENKIFRETIRRIQNNFEYRPAKIVNKPVNKTDETEIENSNDKDIIIAITTKNENTLNDNDESQFNDIENELVNK